MVAAGYRRWSFTRGSNCKVLTGKILLLFFFLYWRSLTGGGRIWKFDCTRDREVKNHTLSSGTSPYRPYKGEKLKVGGRGGLHFGLG